MHNGADDPNETYLRRFHLRSLVDEWLDNLSRAQPENPFMYLTDLISTYSRGGGALVTCENEWCRATFPAADYEVHMSLCSLADKWVRCTICDARVEAGRMRQHKRLCGVESCPNCGEQVVPRLVHLCPYRLRIDADRALRSRCGNSIQYPKVKRPDNAFAPLNFSEATSPLYEKKEISFPKAMQSRLEALQLHWRGFRVKESLLDFCFSRVMIGVEAFREQQALRVNAGGYTPLLASGKAISLAEDSAMLLDTNPNPESSSADCISHVGGVLTWNEFEEVVRQVHSGGVVELNLVRRIIRGAVDILSARRLVEHVRIPEDGEVAVIGDLHGQLKDLREALMLLGGVPNSERYFVFNGDFVDRGPNGMEVLVYVFALLCTFPSYVFLNRGNHEDESINSEYGFQAEVCSKYGLENAHSIFNCILASYEAMPLVTVLDEMILIVHGGVPRDAVTLERIEEIGHRRDIPAAEQKTDDDRILVDILWNDPVESYRSRQIGLRHQGRNWRTSRRGCGVEYLSPITEEFLKLNKLEVVVRSHEMVHAGYERLHGGKCWTVFSASNYASYSGNRGAVAVFQKGNINPVFHTWYVRDAELSKRGSTFLETDRDFACPFTLQTEEIEDENSTEELGGIDIGVREEEEEEEESEGKTVDCSVTKPNCSISFASVEYKAHKSAKLRANALRSLFEIIYRKRYALLSAFVAVDFHRSGIIYKVEWCDVMRNVLDLHLPWYYLCQFISIKKERNGTPGVQYVKFLHRFVPQFSLQFQLPFQVAIMQRIFRNIDLPDDLLNSIDTTEAAPYNNSSTQSNTTPTYGDGENIVASPCDTKRSCMIPAKLNSEAKNQEVLSTVLSSQQSSLAGEKTYNSLKSSSVKTDWRKLILGFNIFVSALRTISPVAAALEDNAMYSLFEYMDRDEKGHITLGEIADLVEFDWTDGEDEFAEILMNVDPMDLDFSTPGERTSAEHNQKEQKGSMSKRKSLEPDSPPNKNFMMSMSTSKECVPPRHSPSVVDSSVNSLGHRSTSPSAVTSAGNGQSSSPMAELVTSENSDFLDSRRRSSTQVAEMTSVKEDNFAAGDESLWLFPALMRLYENLIYGTQGSLLYSFHAMNHTRDDKLTFEQLNLMLGFISQRMRCPLAEAQCHRIFSAICHGGRRSINMRKTTHSGDSKDRSPLSPHGMHANSVSAEESGRPCNSSDGLPSARISESSSDVLYITSEQFISFFSLVCQQNVFQYTPEGNRARQMQSADASISSTHVTLRRSHHGHAASVSFPLNPTVSQGEVLRKWTVDSLRERFEGGISLQQVLQDILGSSTPIQDGRSFVKRGTFPARAARSLTDSSFAAGRTNTSYSESENDTSSSYVGRKKSNINNNNPNSRSDDSSTFRRSQANTRMSHPPPTMRVRGALFGDKTNIKVNETQSSANVRSLNTSHSTAASTCTPSPPSTPPKTASPSSRTSPTPKQKETPRPSINSPLPINKTVQLPDASTAGANTNPETTDSNTTSTPTTTINTDIATTATDPIATITATTFASFPGSTSNAHLNNTLDNEKTRTGVVCTSPQVSRPPIVKQRGAGKPSHFTASAEIPSPRARYDKVNTCKPSALFVSSLSSLYRGESMGVRGFLSPPYSSRMGLPPVRPNVNGNGNPSLTWNPLRSRFLFVAPSSNAPRFNAKMAITGRSMKNSERTGKESGTDTVIEKKFLT